MFVIREKDFNTIAGSKKDSHTINPALDFRNHINVFIVQLRLHYSAVRTSPSPLNLTVAVSWKSRLIGFGHAELDIGDADRAEYR